MLATARLRGARTRHWTRANRQESLTGLFFVAPVVIGTLLLNIAPMIPSLYWSFTEWDFLTAPKWVGLGTYRSIFEGTNSERFWQAVIDTSVYTILAVPGSMAAGIGLALLVNQKMRFSSVWRGLYYLPVVTSGVATAYAWKWVFDVRFGIVNVTLRTLGISGIPWLQSHNAFMAAIVIVTVWSQMGYNMVLFLAGLQGIPSTILEAASVDGATNFQRFRHVVLPLLTPTTFFVLIITIISFFQQFALVYIMGQSRLDIYVLRIWQAAFQESQAGLASAMAVLLFIFLGTLTMIQWRLQRRWVYYD
jgi:multiple sugar transport system permease protein